MALTDAAVQLQGLMDLLANPGQTPTQVSAGEYNFAQLHDIVNHQANELQEMSEGGGSVPYDQVKDLVMHYAPRLPKMGSVGDEMEKKSGLCNKS